MLSKSFGIYVHIPFCIQRCSYCDFATYSKDQIEANQDYVNAVILEAQKRRALFSQKKLKTLYFGGGTPSLLEPHQVSQIIEGIKSLDFDFEPDIEITLEVNPATLNQQKCEALKAAGVNRLSIGCQSFDDRLLKICNREHNVDDTLKTIELTQKYFENYSLDLLFSLPEQNLNQLDYELQQLKRLDPPHISAYCLTLKEGHPMNRDRGSDEEQVAMFAMIFDRFAQQGLHRYETSNFAKPGFESQHNNLYWTDASYWGLGLSAHSYDRDYPNWGARFWNPSNYSSYMNMVEELSPASSLIDSFPSGCHESLKFHESLTDFVHTHLRLKKGLSATLVRHKFGPSAVDLVSQRFEKLIRSDWAQIKDDVWSLTDEGVLVSNQAFAELLFLESDVDKF